MKSYLIDRRQCVTVNNCTSECVKTKSGVPQGSILGPLIFCLFINDMCYLNLHVHTKISLYADDTALFNSGKTIKEVQKNLQEDFELIWKWLDLNSMHLHPQKTKHMLLLKYKNFPLDNVSKIKYLGIIFDASMISMGRTCYICCGQNLSGSRVC